MHTSFFLFSNSVQISPFSAVMRTGLQRYMYRIIPCTAPQVVKLLQIRQRLLFYQLSILWLPQSRHNPPPSILPASPTYTVCNAEILLNYAHWSVTEEPIVPFLSVEWFTLIPPTKYAHLVYLNDYINLSHLKLNSTVHVKRVSHEVEKGNECKLQNYIIKHKTSPSLHGRDHISHERLWSRVATEVSRYGISRKFREIFIPYFAKFFHGCREISRNYARKNAKNFAKFRVVKVLNFRESSLG